MTRVQYMLKTFEVVGWHRRTIPTKASDYCRCCFLPITSVRHYGYKYIRKDGSIYELHICNTCTHFFHDQLLVTDIPNE